MDRSCPLLRLLHRASLLDHFFLDISMFSLGEPVSDMAETLPFELATQVVTSITAEEDGTSQTLVEQRLLSPKEMKQKPLPDSHPAQGCLSGLGTEGQVPTTTAMKEGGGVEGNKVPSDSGAHQPVTVQAASAPEVFEPKAAVPSQPVEVSKPADPPQPVEVSPHHILDILKEKDREQRLNSDCLDPRTLLAGSCPARTTACNEKQTETT